MATKKNSFNFSPNQLETTSLFLQVSNPKGLTHNKNFQLLLGNRPPSSHQTGSNSPFSWRQKGSAYVTVATQQQWRRRGSRRYKVYCERISAKYTFFTFFFLVRPPTTLVWSFRRLLFAHEILLTCFKSFEWFRGRRGFFGLVLSAIYLKSVNKIFNISLLLKHFVFKKK